MAVPALSSIATRSATGRTRGFSLIELLVAMTLGLFLLGGMIAVFAGNRRAGEINTAMTSLQENARFALNVIASDIRMAGHQGCLDFNGSAVDVIADDPPTSDLRATAINGRTVTADGKWATELGLGTGTGAFAAPEDNEAIVGTHAIALQFGGPDAVPLREGMENASGVPDATVPLPLDGTLPLAVGDLALVSTCEDGELFRVTSVATGTDGMDIGHAAAANSRGSFLEPYGLNDTEEQVRVMPFSTHVYYIGDTGLKNGAGEPIRALYQQSMPFNDDDNPPVELVQGVENMRLSFGVGGNGGRLRYVASGTPFDPSRVRSVRIGLLMSSWDEVASEADSATYTLAGQSIDPSASASDGTAYKADRRFRLAFNTTVKVRNRRAAN